MCELYFEFDCLDCFSPMFASSTEKSFNFCSHNRKIVPAPMRKRTEQEAQLPQRNNASAAHMEGAKPSSPFPSDPSGYTYAYGRIRNPQQTYVKRAVRKTHFKLNRAFKVIKGYPYLCRQESRTVYCRNVQLIPT